MADLNAKVRERALRFANDIAALVQQSIAEEVIRLVGGGRSAPRSAPSRKPAKGGLAASRARSKQISDEQVLAAIRGKKGGASAIQIAAATGLRGGALSYRLNKLRARKKAVSHQVPKAARRSDERIDVGDLDQILTIDPARRICTAESGVTFVDLVRATLAHGLVPQLVPELKTITVGGAVSGCSV